jgi:CheY-like chemotaxis protein
MINLKIVIAEDDEASEKFLTYVMKKYSNNVFNARTGVEAINVCRSNSGIDLVLMDIKMPEMDGYEATRQIRRFNSCVVIIAQTAYAMAGDRAKALAAGCNDYIAKPINIDVLEKILQKHFN